MALITEQDRIKEFENLKEILGEVDVAADILKEGSNIKQTCLLLSMPTNVEDWKTEFKEDMHMASGYLVQMGEDENQQTKYLMLYMPIQVDLTGVDELTLLRFVSETNKNLPVGTCFIGPDETTGRLLFQVKWTIGGYVGEFLDEGVVCEAIFELGAIYDMLKAQLQEMVK